RVPVIEIAAEMLKQCQRYAARFAVAPVGIFHAVGRLHELVRRVDVGRLRLLENGHLTLLLLQSAIYWHMPVNIQRNGRFKEERKKFVELVLRALGALEVLSCERIRRDLCKYRAQRGGA